MGPWWVLGESQVLEEEKEKRGGFSWSAPTPPGPEAMDQQHDGALAPCTAAGTQGDAELRQAGRQRERCARSCAPMHALLPCWESHGQEGEPA